MRYPIEKSFSRLLSALLIMALALPTPFALALRPIQEGKGRSGLEESLRSTPSGLEEVDYPVKQLLAGLFQKGMARGDRLNRLVDRLETFDEYQRVQFLFGFSWLQGVPASELAEDIFLGTGDQSLRARQLLMGVDLGRLEQRQGGMDDYFYALVFVLDQVPGLKDETLRLLQNVLATPRIPEEIQQVFRFAVALSRVNVVLTSLTFRDRRWQGGVAGVESHLDILLGREKVVEAVTPNVPQYRGIGSLQIAMAHLAGSILLEEAVQEAGTEGVGESVGLRELLSSRGVPVPPKTSPDFMERRRELEDVILRELDLTRQNVEKALGNLQQQRIRPIQQGYLMRQLALAYDLSGIYNGLRPTEEPGAQGGLTDLTRSGEYQDRLRDLRAEQRRRFGLDSPAAGLEETPEEALARQAEDVLSRAGEDPQGNLAKEIGRDIQALAALSVSSKFHPTHLRVALDLLAPVSDPQEYAAAMRFLAELALADKEQDWSVPKAQAELRNKTLPRIAIGSWQPIPGSDYQTAPLIALPALYQGFVETSGLAAAQQSRRLVRKGRAHGMVNVWTQDPRTLWKERNHPIRSKVLSELARRLGANHVEIEIPPLEERQALAQHIGARPGQVSLSRLSSDYLTGDAAVPGKGLTNEDAYRAITRALMAALYLRVYDFHRYNLGHLKDNDQYRTMWYDSEQGLHPDLEQIDPYAVAFLSHFFAVRKEGQGTLSAPRREEFAAILSIPEISEGLAAVEGVDLESAMQEILESLPVDVRQSLKAEGLLTSDYLPRLQRWQGSFRQDADRFFRLLFYYMRHPDLFEQQRQRLIRDPFSIEVFSDAVLSEVKNDSDLVAIQTALGMAAGLEEQQAAWRTASELMEGFRSRSTVDSRAVVVIGGDLAQRIPGLQVLAGLEERVVIDREDLSDTLARAAQLGDTVYFYGDPQRGAGLEELAGRSGLSLSFVLRNPGEDPKIALVLRRIFEDLGVPSADVPSGLEEFTRQVETLGLAA